MGAIVYEFPKSEYFFGLVVPPENPVGFYVDAEEGYYSGDTFFVHCKNDEAKPSVGERVRIRYRIGEQRVAPSR